MKYAIEMYTYIHQGRRVAATQIRFDNGYLRQFSHKISKRDAVREAEIYIKANTPRCDCTPPASAPAEGTGR